MSERLRASLNAEQTPSVSSWRSAGWLKPVSGLAIAASVALIAIVVTAPQPGKLPGAVGETADSGPVNQPFISPNTLSLAPISQAASYTASRVPDTSRLNAYLLRHNQVARTAGRQGFVSFVPIVATQATSRMERSQSEENRLGKDARNQKVKDSGAEQETAANR